MSAPKREDIVGKSAEELDQLVCAICMEIFTDPVITKCCGQTYCRKCIEEWLNGRKTCPNCRCSLTIRVLVSVKALANIIAELPVKCRYLSDGCPEVIAFGRLSSHMKTCQYRLCKCGYRGPEEGHNCVEYLMAENAKLKKQLADYCQAVSPTFGTLPMNYVGRYISNTLLTTREDIAYSRFLEYLKLTDLEPNIINRMLPIIKISKNDDVFTIVAGLRTLNGHITSSFRTLFQLSEELVNIKPNMGTIRTVFTIEDNKLIQRSHYNGKVVNIVSELKDNVMTITGSVEDVVFTRFYHRI